MDFTVLFCNVDDFCQVWEPRWRKRLICDRRRKRNRSTRLALSEIMTILIAFHSSRFRTFKHYYQELLRNYRTDFPALVSYERFIELIPRALEPLCAYLLTRRGPNTGIAFVDSTALAVCGNKRITRHRVFRGVAALGRTTMGWFFGFKLHLIINECGELLGIKITPGNMDDRVPVPRMAKGLTGTLFGDKGYISQGLFEQLWDEGLKLVTSIRKNMRNRLRLLRDRILLRKRSVIETVNDQLKNVAQIEHTRHRSVWNFMAHLIAGLISYTHQPHKPSIRLTDEERTLLGINKHRCLLLT